MGRGLGLTLLLKSIPEDALNGKVYLPTDLCLKTKMNYDDVLKGLNSDSLAEVVFQVASHAKIHLDEARRKHQKLPSDLKSFLLPCVPALRYLERLERAGFAPFTADLHDNAMTDLQLKVSLAWSNFVGKIWAPERREKRNGAWKQKQMLYTYTISFTIESFFLSL